MMRSSRMISPIRALVVALAISGCRDVQRITPPQLLSGPSRSIASTAGAFVYVTNQLSNSVSVIETATNTVVATIALGLSPDGLAITPDGAFVYVAGGSSNVSVISTATNSVVANVSVGSSPRGVAITPDGNFVYVTNPASNTVSVIATATNSVIATVTGLLSPQGLAITPNGAFVYVVNGLPESGSGVLFLSVIATATNTAVDIAVVGNGLISPADVAITPDGAFAYVSKATANSLSLIETSTNSLVSGSIAVGLGPLGLAVTPSGAFVYVANRVSDAVSVIATATNTVVATIGVGSQPKDVAITPDGAFAYVPNAGSNSVSVISTATNAVVGTVAVGTRPFAVAITPNVVIEVGLDIRPGSARNPINPKSMGKIPVAILSTADFDASTAIDPASLTFGHSGDEPSLAFCQSREDVNGDGLADLLCQFQMEQTGLQAGDTQGILRGNTITGIRIEGHDEILVVGA